MIDDTVHLEERHLAQVAAELAAEFPDVPREVIERLVRQANERYETAKVRSFLTILVSKDVRAQLRADAYGADLPRQLGPVSAEARGLKVAVGRPA
jgi:hypothetical protein